MGSSLPLLANAVLAFGILAVLTSADNYFHYGFTDDTTRQLCQSPCDAGACFTSWSDALKHRCHLNTTFRLTRARTDSGRMCDGPCRKWGEAQFWCRTGTSRENCQPESPSLRTKEHDGTLPDSCFRPGRAKRVVPAQVHDPYQERNNELWATDGTRSAPVDVDDYVEAVTALFAHAEDPAYVFRRNLNANNPVDVVVFTRLEQNPVHGEWNVKRGGRTLVTTFMSATIRPQHLRQIDRSESRTPDTATLNDHMRRLEAKTNDDKGHLLAWSLGGSHSLYNIVPQEKTINRWMGGNESPWRRLERTILEFLRKQRAWARVRNPWAQWSIMVHYHPDRKSPVYRSLRPRGFTLNVMFNDGDRAIARVRNFYATNTPDDRNAVLRRNPCGEQDLHATTQRNPGGPNCIDDTKLPSFVEILC